MGKIFSYNGNNVRMRKMNGYILVCLTDFAKPFPDKNLSHIVNSKELINYVTRMSEIQNCSSTDLLEVTKGGDVSQQGTWAHHRVAIRVAQRLSTDFAIWVDDKIEELLTTGYTSIQPQYNIPRSFSEALQLAADQAKQIEEQQHQIELKEEIIESQEKEIKEAAPKVNYYNDHLQSVNTLTSTQVAKQIGMDAEKLHKKLKETGILYKQSGQWLLHSPYSTWGLHSTRTQTYTRNDGALGTSIYTVWTEKGRRFIISLYENEWNVRKAINQIKGDISSAV
ncbi:phage antirepressor KilAC domain-containing protein [Bacteroides salyersiae]|uniref:phage antirepressor KilAC domain-containing protein n=2 Tax=Bacteroides salyersiae TaxID=291644 RepID=UPI0034A57CD7